MDTGYIHQLAEQIHQAGLDQAAEVLAALLVKDLETTCGGSEDYRDGIRDALAALVKAGAAEPR